MLALLIIAFCVSLGNTILVFQLLGDIIGESK